MKAKHLSYVGYLDTGILGHVCPTIPDDDSDNDIPLKWGDEYFCCVNLVKAAEFVCKRGGKLRLRRNPRNPDNSNTVEVLGADGALLGHLADGLQDMLAPLLDSGRVQVKGDDFYIEGSCHNIPGIPFSLLVYADKEWFQARPAGNKLAALWARFQRELSISEDY